MFLETIIATGIVSFCLLYFSFKIESDHYLLKLLAVIIAFCLLIVAPATSNLAETHCESLVVNETVGGAVTSYTYDQVCHTVDSTANNAFLNVYVGFVVILFLYISTYVVFEAIDYIRRVTGKK